MTEDRDSEIHRAFMGDIPKDAYKSRYGRLPWMLLDEPGPELEYLVDDFITKGDKSIIGGPSKSGKSFLAIHMALSVARGLPFFGRDVDKGLVVYQAGEGAKGIRKRLRAYRQHFKVSKEEYVPFELLRAPIDLYRHDGDTKPLITEIQHIAMDHLARGASLKLVVIDTLATAIGGADEISGKDMGQVMSNISRINAETGAAVLLVHHLNAEGKKLRGHTSIYANLDQVVFVTRDEETKVRTVRLDKQKDDEEGLTINFELLSVELGMRPNGKPITSCVVVDVGERQKAAGDQTKSRGFRLGRDETTFFRAFWTALQENGQLASAGSGLAPGTMVVHWSHVREAFERISPFDIGDETDEGVRRRKKRMQAVLENAGRSLHHYGVIGRENPFLWWTGRPVSGFPETLQQPAPPDDGLPF